jgi:hypothetical protein
MGCLFQIRFGVFILEIEKFEGERIFDSFFERHGITRFRLLSFVSMAALFFWKRDAFVKLALDLPVKLPDGLTGA